MKAFLGKINKEWLDDFVYISRYPLEERGYKVIPFDEDDMENTLYNKDITKDDICIASVEATTKFFELAGVDTPLHIGYPEQLKSYLGRNIELTTFGELDNKFPYFVKPSEQVKLFTGDIVSTPNHLEYLVQFDNCKPDTKIYKSEIVEFLTEYRVFVSNGKVYGMKHYKGDFMKFIDDSIIDEMIKDFTDCPSAFTLDIGLTNDGRTLLVEVNDMWAIGSYGLDGRDYALLCARRMKEIMKNC
jgi:hypothetical protein